MTFDHLRLRALRYLDTRYPLGFTAGGNRQEDFNVNRQAMDVGLDFISYFFGDLPNSFIPAQKQKGVTIIC